MQADGQDHGTLHTWLRVVRLWAATTALCAVASLPGSSVFSVRDVDVVGASPAKVHVLRETAGLRPGMPLAAVRPEEVGRRLRRLAWVREAQVEVVWPGRVVVRVAERTPQAVVKLPDGAQVLVDREGVALQRTPSTPALPVVLAPPLPWVQLGEVVPAEGVVQLVGELASLPERERARLRWLRWQEGGDYVVGTRDGWVARVASGQLLRGLQTAREVAGALGRRGIQVAVVDVRFKDRAVVQPVR